MLAVRETRVAAARAAASDAVSEACARTRAYTRCAAPRARTILRAIDRARFAAYDYSTINRVHIGACRVQLNESAIRCTARRRGRALSCRGRQAALVSAR